MSAVDPVQAGHDAYDEVMARGGTREEASHAHLVAREGAHGHPDAEERATLLVAVLDEGHARGLLLGGHEAACGLRDRALSDGTVPTEGLRDALAVLRGLPTP